MSSARSSASSRCPQMRTTGRRSSARTPATTAATLLPHRPDAVAAPARDSVWANSFIARAATSRPAAAGGGGDAITGNLRGTGRDGKAGAAGAMRFGGALVVVGGDEVTIPRPRGADVAGD